MRAKVDKDGYLVIRSDWHRIGECMDENPAILLAGALMRVHKLKKEVEELEEELKKKSNSKVEDSLVKENLKLEGELSDCWGNHHKEASRLLSKLQQISSEKNIWYKMYLDLKGKYE